MSENDINHARPNKSSKKKNYKSALDPEEDIYNRSKFAFTDSISDNTNSLDHITLIKFIRNSKIHVSWINMCPPGHQIKIKINNLLLKLYITPYITYNSLVKINSAKILWIKYPLDLM